MSLKKIGEAYSTDRVRLASVVHWRGADDAHDLSSIGEISVECTLEGAGKATGRTLALTSARLVRDGRTYATGMTTLLQPRRSDTRGRYVLRLSNGASIPVTVR
jgi:hypothetical protein